MHEYLYLNLKGVNMENNKCLSCGTTKVFQNLICYVCWSFKEQMKVWSDEHPSNVIEETLRELEEF